MVNIQEIVIVNGIAILMMAFLLVTRRKYRESIHREDKVYDLMAYLTLVGAFIEIISFLVDQQTIPYGNFLNYMSNSLCFLGTVSIAVLWCAYVDLRIYRNYTRTNQRMKYLILPWLIEVLVLISNLLGSDILFDVTKENIYQRGKYVVFVYIILMFYYAYSIYLVKKSKDRVLMVRFFPVNYFIGPCLLGTIIQLLNYGISASWVSVAIALTFVQMQSYSENLMLDSLSGLFNSRYMNNLLQNVKYDEKSPFYGIMIDLNDFKTINDTYGHNIGNLAIQIFGDLLLSSIPDGGVAIRYAGDEFMVLLPGFQEKWVDRTIQNIQNSMDEFNQNEKEKFQLSASMGYAKLEAMDQGCEAFLTRMDEAMYEAKRDYHTRVEKNRRRHESGR